jgi:hypothetical protein
LQGETSRITTASWHADLMERTQDKAGFMDYTSDFTALLVFIWLRTTTRKREKILNLQEKIVLSECSQRLSSYISVIWELAGSESDPFCIDEVRKDAFFEHPLRNVCLIVPTARQWMLGRSSQLHKIGMNRIKCGLPLENESTDPKSNR